MKLAELRKELKATGYKVNVKRRVKKLFKKYLP
jgi:hypothetical protein